MGYDWGNKHPFTWRFWGCQWFQGIPRFYLSSTVSSSSGAHRIVKLGSCWGGWGSQGQNPSYHAPGVYRMCRDYMRLGGLKGFLDSRDVWSWGRGAFLFFLRFKTCKHEGFLQPELCSFRLLILERPSTGSYNKVAYNHKKQPRSWKVKLKTNWNSTWFNWPSHLMAVFLQIMLQFFENRLVFHVDSIMVLIHSVIAPAIVYNSDLTRNSITCVHTCYNIYIYIHNTLQY